jgi:branched-chain amino acid transport system permease protein
MAMQKQPSMWVQAIRGGLIGGAVSLLICLVGMTEEFNDRAIVQGIITMGQVLWIAPVLILAFTMARRTAAKGLMALLVGVVSGLAGGAVLAALLLLGAAIDLRAMFVNASPTLYGILTFGLGLEAGIPMLLVGAAIVGLAGAALDLVPNRPRQALIQAVIAVVLIGLVRDLVINIAYNWGPIGPMVTWMFAQGGLDIPGALFLLIVVGGIAYWRYADAQQRAAAAIKRAQQPRWQRWATLAAIALLILLLPRILGLFLSDVLDTVGIFILMGLGLNIVVGFAGLLDLGYVAFFAIGAYSMGVLTSPERIATPLTYWEALPIALLVAVLAGVILGLPVLKMRGDYLAIVTLGFGEIVRLLVLSDWLRPWLGGPEGIQLIAHPMIFGTDFGTQPMIYFVIVVFIGIATFIAVRLKDSRLGRAWMALREDEDVAKAMGINHVTTKLLAFASGAFFAGLGGTLFAAKLSSAYPQSFQFLVSINVLSLIIIGGMGSIPGVIVGGFALVGLPEILREFADFRYLVYGAVLVAMMLTRPEGLLPEARRGLELRETEAAEVAAEAAAKAAALAEKGAAPKPAPKPTRGRR